ncbi:MAG TPA: Hsp20/alpha crystallin family protein [Acidimicrobiales bacterium]|nr:Hsp20/alpha crystallin family protein [Acidimicrobiales bacterium]
MLTRFEPISDFDRLSSELFGALSRRAMSMPIDAYRHEDQWVVKVDLPGVDPSTIDLTVDRSVLRIDAVRDWRPGEGDRVLAAERPRGAFRRQLVLSEDIDTTSIRADYNDGVLTVVLPVAETAKPKKVMIATGAKAGPRAAQETEQQAA